MARRQLLTEDERRVLFGVPDGADALTRHYSFTRSDQELLAERRGNANRLGFAVQLALLRHPGIALAHMEEPVDPLVAWLSTRLEIPVEAFGEYAGRTQTMTDHARILATAFGLRAATVADLPFMIEAAAQAAWSTGSGAADRLRADFGVARGEGDLAGAGSDRARGNRRPGPCAQACR